MLDFYLTLTDDDDNEFVTNLYFNIKSFDLLVSRGIIINDSNGDNVLDPDEAASLSLSVTNNGTISSPLFTCLLETQNADLDFIQNDLIAEMGFYDVESLEGFLFPETYKVDSYVSEENLIKIFIEEYLDRTKYLREDINDIYKTMIIASIIEAETNNVDEMDTISSVYNNRIKKGMLLQADPTVLYYMTEDDLKKFKNSKPGTRAFGSVWKKYKKMDNPYNTYKYIIPPGPINSPGIDAIKAALNPAKTNHIFMVMNNKLGRHLFSNNEKDHSRNIRRN